MQVDWAFYYFVETARLLDPLVQLIGLGISIWAYRMTRKVGYLIVAAYFFLATCSLTIIPAIRHALYERRHPRTELSVEEQAQYTSELMALQWKYFPSGPPPAGQLNISFPFGSILLVTGIWLLAKCEARQSTGQITRTNAD